MRAARALVDEKVASDETVYGVTTGFGSLADRADPAGPGRAAPVRPGSFARDGGRAAASARGGSGDARCCAPTCWRSGTRACGRIVVERMVEMLNRDLIPAVPRAGFARGIGRPRAARAPGAAADRPRPGPGGRHGPAMPRAARRRRASSRSTSRPRRASRSSTAPRACSRIGILALPAVEALAKAVDVAAAMSVEASMGTDRAFDERLQRLRPHPGQAASASNLRRLMAGSGVARPIASRRTWSRTRTRCGARRRSTARRATCAGTSRGVLRDRGRAVSDNPLVLPDDGEVLVRGELPRAAGGAGARRARDGRRAAGEHLGTPPVPPARPVAVERPAAVPGADSG